MIISPTYPLITTPQSPDSNSPPPNFNLHSTPPNLLSSRHSQLPSLSSPSLIHGPNSPEDTAFDTSNKIPIHKVWQSTKIYPPTPPLMNFDGITLISVNSVFNQPDRPSKIYSSCRFPPEKNLNLFFQNIFQHFSPSLLIVQLLFHQH